MKSETIGTRFAALRKELNLSQGKFSIELNITQQTYSLIEKDRRPPNVKILQLIAEKFNVNLNWLVLGYGDMFRGFIENIELYREKSEELRKLTTKINDLVKDIK
jgi:transcriptional regulator with XRE-family HTH domain